MNRPGKRSSLGACALAIALAVLGAWLVAAPGAGAAGGTAMGWGYNYSGQVGNGTVGDNPACYCVSSPAPLLGVDGVTQIDGGYEFGLALRSDGSVLSWGYNYSGELGNGNTDVDPVPKPVAGVTNAIAVAAGTAHALVLLADGTILAWGENNEGQLGLGSSAGPETCHTTTQCSTRPLQVPGIANAIAVSGGTYNSYALLADGRVLAWGDGNLGATGTGASVENSCSCVPTPSVVPGVEHAVAISGGQYTGAALLSDGTVRAWGANVLGSLGTGSTVPSSGCACQGPVASALAGVRQISLGGAHGIALLSDGLAQSWGWNANGQVGIGVESTEPCYCVPTPTTIGALSESRKVDAGDEHSAALSPAGTLSAWGENDYGQLGDGTIQVNRPSPVAVSGLSGVSDFVTTEFNTYAILGPTQALSVDFAGAGAGTVGGSGIVCSADCSRPFAQGQVKVLRADPAVAGQFAGWTGAGCTGTGPCFARLDGDQTVTATFGAPAGTRITKFKLAGKKKKRKTARLRFEAPGVVTGFQCLLVRPKPKRRGGATKSVKRRKPKFSACASGKAYKKLKPGRYTFRVRALNSLGADADPAKRTFKVRALRKKKKQGR